MSFSTGTPTDVYEKIVTVTQLPDKMAANGKNRYWDCHVAGIDWENPDAEFNAAMTKQSHISVFRTTGS